MKQEDFMLLVEPVGQLIGFCKSASDLNADSNLDGWSKRLVELADNLDNAWKKTAYNLPGVE